MSPTGRVNVALAGLTTSALAVFLTLLDNNAAGRATTNAAEPTTVATRQAGRTTRASATTSRGLLSSDAELEATLPRPTANTQIVVKTLALIPSTFSEPAPFVEYNLSALDRKSTRLNSSHLG